MRKEIDYTVTYPEVQQYSDYDLADLMMYADRDQKDNYWAKCVYWMCVLEISNRNGVATEYTDIICVGAISNEAGDKIFIRDNIYTLYAIDDIALVFDEGLHPYVFTTKIEDMYCVSRFFGLT